ncbi:MAG: ORF6N domain-containing protein [Sphingobacteriales bacterium]|nr:ORF6N domain-containing protein [Sphingobacteriales bacterium]MBI3717165.1 ORF6N domain-containing protein [Sphingobacteriales bacterium]
MKAQLIQERIYEVRGEKVMLDFDLAKLYEVETRVFNQAIKRNTASFPKDFMFRLTVKEWKEILASQVVLIENNGTSNSSQFVMSSIKHRGAKYTPYAFTEHGVTMLASVLKSPKARKMNITIVRAFIALKKFAGKNVAVLNLIKELKERIDEHDAQLKSIYDALENMLDKKEDERQKKINWEKRERIGFKNSSSKKSN